MSATSHIIVETRRVYGLPTVYPVCPLAKRLAAVAGTKTLTLHALDEIKAMGFTIYDRTALATQIARVLTTAA